MAISLVATYLGSGILLGLSAGFSPGPLLALVISQTIRHGLREGVKVAMAPLVTDLPIILVSFLVLRRLAGSEPLLGVISLAGGVFVLRLAVDSLRAGVVSTQLPALSPRSLGRGALVNLLSPHPYLFWLTVGAPLMVKAWDESPPASAAFLVGFYLCLIGSKVLLAILSGKYGSRAGGRLRQWIPRFLGALLLIFAALLFSEGLHLLGCFP
ncbi:MAG: LysE family transporter [Syntrophobacteraceae bacterium]|jgi:threonine/homoserine/homoserine lactone efflux protein|nr:LysE family transporter [Syntrophobacteraceae bacterium]